MEKSIFATILVGVTLSIGLGQQKVDSSWTLATESAAFPSRFDPATAVFKNKLWVIGGNPYSGSALKDVWSSSDGKNWDRVTDAAACLPRIGHTVLVFQDKLWVIAGATPKGSPVSYSRSDVWNSSDGVTWEKVSDSAAFPSRVFQSGAVFNGKMWVFGGQETRKLAKDHGDVWSSEDGANWTLANATAFAPRSFLKSVVFQNKIWVLGGINRGGLLKDILSSSDGLTWTTAPATTGFNPSDHFFLSTVFNGQVWVHDQYKVSTTSDMIRWTTVTSSGPFARLGLHEMNGKLWSIGALTKGTTTTHAVYSYTFPGPLLPKKTSLK